MGDKQKGGEYTPGPWRWNSTRTFLVSERNGMVHSEEHRVKDADARLIEAAPEMLAALQALRDVVVRDSHARRWPVIIAMADAAIAKATGEGDAVSARWR